MMPERINRATAASHAQSIVDNLNKAVKRGAIVARYDNGIYQIYPSHVVDKDGFEEDVRAYAQHLLEQGVDRKKVHGNASEIKDKFDGGTAVEQFKITNTLSSALNGFNRLNIRLDR